MHSRREFNTLCLNANSAPIHSQYSVRDNECEVRSLTPIQCKMARVAVGLGVRELAEAANVAPSTVTRFEGGGGVHVRTIEAMRTTLESAGVEFTNGVAPGVKLRSKD